MSAKRDHAAVGLAVRLGQATHNRSAAASTAGAGQRIICHARSFGGGTDRRGRAAHHLETNQPERGLRKEPSRVTSKFISTFERDSLASQAQTMLMLEVVNGAQSEGEPSSLATTFMGREDETQAVPDVQSGGVHVGPDLVTWLQLYGTGTMYALRPVRRGIRHYTFGSASDQDIVISSPYVSARHGRLVRSHLGLRVVDLTSRNGTYFKGRRKESFYLEPGQTFVVGSRAHCLLALNDEMHAHYPALTTILGYEDEHVAQSETPCPSDLIVAAVAGSHMLIVSEPHCDQDRLAHIIHATSLLRQRPLVAFDQVTVEQAMQGDSTFSQAATVLLNLEGRRVSLDPCFTSRLFSPRYLTRVIALARSVRVANTVLGEHHVKQMKQVRLKPLSGRPGAIHRLLDTMFQERGSSLRVSAMTLHNQDALRYHRWARNFASLREAADRLVVIAQQGSLRKAALALDISPSTFHHWYANTVGLTPPLIPDAPTP